MSEPPTKRLSKPTTPRGSTTRHRQLSPAAVVLPGQVDFLVITTLIGGTIGGYIVYAGAHRSS